MKNIKKLFRTVFSILTIITLIISMDTTAGQAKKRIVKLNKVVLNYSSFQLQKGKKLKLKASFRPKNTTQKKLEWKSSKKSVATVSQKGIVKAIKTGSAKITVSVKGTKKKATCKIQVIKNNEDAYNYPPITSEIPEPSPEPEPSETPVYTPFPAGTVYCQRYDVTRWYENGTNMGHEYHGYKYGNSAIWMVGFIDNEFSTTEDAYCSYPIDLSRVNNAEFADEKNPHDFRGEELRVRGEFSYDGTDQSTILFQIEYTQPADYPILWRWEKGASKLENAGDAKLNKVKSNITDKGYGKYGAEELKHGETGKLDINFTIPKDAQNNDGLYGSICLYFPNKPDGALVYRSDNTFHFKNFSITY